mgnify:CR=1 FL=1
MQSLHALGGVRFVVPAFIASIAFCFWSTAQLAADSAYCL